MTASENQGPQGSVPDDPYKRNRLLCDAARAGDVGEVRRLLALGCDPKGYFDAAQTAESFSLDTLRLLRPQDLEPLSDDIGPKADCGMEKPVRELFARLSEAPMDDEIPLFEAVASASMDCVAALLDAGADPMVRDNLGRCAMSLAKTPEIAVALVRAGVPLEINERDAESGLKVRSPLEDAISRGSEGLEVARAVIAAGANVNAVRDDVCTVFMMAVGSDRDPQMLRLLVASGADPHAVSPHEFNAWHAAIDVNSDANAEESVRDTFGYLKELGVNMEQRDDGGQTPLAHAISRGGGVEVRVLCELGADVNAVCALGGCSREGRAWGLVPLIFHAVNGHGSQSDAKLEAMLDAGANADVAERGLLTPLSYVVSTLADDSADPEPTFQRLSREIADFRVVSRGSGVTRNAFLASINREVREFVEKIAATLKPPSGSESAGKLRAERVNMAALLIAEACWKRCELSSAETGPKDDSR